MLQTEVVVRMPPSPTGSLHLGTARTALFNFLFAAHYKGKIIFRWEDTDRERSRAEFETEILEGLAWLEMDFKKESEQIYRQTENESLHHEWLEKLWKEGKIFPCFTTPEEIETQRKKAESEKKNFVFWSPYRDETKESLEKKMKAGEPFVWRLRVPKEETIVFGDLIRGKISVQAETLGDFVVARSDGSVLYLLANVLDDWTQGVTHVIRGEDHISNTPKQILLYQALGVEEPYFAHIPLVLDAQRRKLSKRNADPNMCVLIKDFQAAGFVPEAVVNGLALLGWNPKTEQEIFSLEELEQCFDLQNVNPGAAQYNFEKMQWFNAQWIRDMDIGALRKRYNAFGAKKLEESQEKMLMLAREKSRNLKEIESHLEYMMDDPGIDPTLLVHEKMKIDATMAKKMLREVETMLKNIPPAQWNETFIQNESFRCIEALGVKNGPFLNSFRVALSNRSVSVGPFGIAAVLGKEETIRRIERAQK